MQTARRLEEELEELDDMDEDERAELDAALDRSLAAEAGGEKGVDAFQSLAAVRERLEQRIATRNTRR